MNCSHPYSSFSYSSHCYFECNEGFWLRGASAMTCNTSGHWSQEVPTCQCGCPVWGETFVLLFLVLTQLTQHILCLSHISAVQCEALRTLSLPLSMNCTHPLGTFSFGSQCIFSCKEGYSLNGTEELVCSSTGVWSDRLPTCTGNRISTEFLSQWKLTHWY